MINILSYFFYNLSNLIFLILIPSNFEKFFLLNYSIASGIFTFVVFYNFSKKKIVPEKLFFMASLLFLLLAIKIESDSILIWTYTFLLIYSDYFFSQVKINFINFLFKIILMLSSFLLYNNLLSPKNVLIIKIILILFFFLITYIFLKNYKIKLLSINSPLIYNFLTCLIYFSSLFIITLVIETEILKIVYISFQLLIGMQLKIFDIKIRNINFKYFNIYYFFSFVCFVYLIILCLFINSYSLLIFYLLIFLILNLVKKKFIVRTYKIDKKIE